MALGPAAEAGSREVEAGLRILGRVVVTVTCGAAARGSDVRPDAERLARELGAKRS